MKTAYNRSHVITVASDLFLRKGLNNTSMDDVVKESGVSKSNIYYHFKSKEELLVAVLDYRINMIQQSLHSIQQASHLPVTSRLQLVFASLAEELASRSCIGGCPIQSLMSAPMTVTKDRINQFFEGMQAMVAMLLSEGVDRGEFRRDIPISQTATLFVSAIEGSIMLAESQGDSTVIVQSGETLLHLLQV
ncbi:TetR/AcrR family transcriptional regulator [Brevibacillus dissolubilis]|uniref:TetR/AcrR family transcriptional regulator n=1 Tax=Brevibacillus dissolubilis TaxID=1844116 RepID=UPI00111776E6|nr:TetR/AcrR family transcriptional regulator [Brevibacillus dissolubilis]